MPISIGKFFSRLKDINDQFQGNSYTSISTQDPNDVLISQEYNRFPTSYSMSFLEKKTFFTPSVHEGTVGCLAAVRPGMVISGGSDSVISLNNIDTGKCVLKWLGHLNEITKVGYKNTGGKHYILSGSRDATLKLWQFNKQTTEQTFKGHNLTITGLAILEDGKIISGSRDTTLKLWDINSGKIIYQVERSRNLVTHISLSNLTNKIAQSSEDKEIKIWDVKSLELTNIMPKKNHIQTHVDMAPDGFYCLSSSNGFNGDGCEITLWDLRTNKILKEFKGHETSVTSAVFLPQQITWKKLMLSTSAMGTVKIWNIDDGNCVWTEELPIKCDLLAGVGFNDGNIVVSGTSGVLCHLCLLGRAGRPYLKTISIQTDSVISFNEQVKNSNSKNEIQYNSQNDYKKDDVVNDFKVDKIDIVHINEDHCKIIRETFEVYKKNGVNNTLKVFIRMFSEHPEYKFIWPQFRQIPDSSFILSSALKQHAVVYLGGLKSIIKNINDEKKIDMIIKKIAFSHVKWDIKKSHIQNMLPEILFVLKEILINYNKEVEDAWTSLYTIIGDLIENFKKNQKNVEITIDKV